MAHGCDNNTDCQITFGWDNSLALPSYGGMNPNVGLAGAFAGFAGEKLVIAGGANFPTGFPWTGGKKTWWTVLYAFCPKSGEWEIYNDFFDKPIGYGVSLQYENGIICIGGCDAETCYSDVHFIGDREGDVVFERNRYPSLPVPLANAAGTILNDKIYIIGGQESMTEEQSSHNFLMLDLKNPDNGWVTLPAWPGESRAYGVCTAQSGKVYMFSGRSFGPGRNTIMYRDAYSYEPQKGLWERIEGDFPVMAATAVPYAKSGILIFGGVEEILPTTPAHPGFSRKVWLFDAEDKTMTAVGVSPYPVPVTTTAVARGNRIFFASGEMKPGIRTPNILKASVTP